MIRKYYMADDPTAAVPETNAATPPGAPSTPGLPGGPPAGGNPPGAPAAPKGYSVTSPKERSDWNGFLDYASKQGGNVSDPKQQATLMGQYKKANPDFSITTDRIPAIQYEAYQLRKGDTFGNLGSKELGYLRQGLSPNFLNADTSNIGKLYYPQEQGYGTDVENYYNSKFNPAAVNTAPPSSGASPTTSTAPAATTGAPASPNASGAVPAVWADHGTALKRAQQLAMLPGNDFIHGRADTLIHANYIPPTDTKSIGQSSTEAAKALGINPALFYASAAEEGMTGLVPDKNGTVATGDIDLNSKYPVDGFTNFGLDHFHDQFPELVKRGYLPKDFDYEKHTIKNPENGEVVNSGNFKSIEDAVKAKAAFVKMENDNLQGWAKTNNVKLSPAANDFFTFVAYNGGPGTAHKMINYYKGNGMLDGDKFLQNAPGKKVDPGDSYGKVLPRWKMAQLLQNEKIIAK